MEAGREKITARVLETSKPSGEGMHGAEPEVWTESMIRALDRGVQGGKWHSLIDKVTNPRTLECAWKKVKANQGSAGVDSETVGDFERNAPGNLEYLRKLIVAQQFEPRAVRRVEIPKAGGKTRPLGIPTVRDRVVQNAVRMTIEPIFERDFSDNSYGFRPGRSAHQAIDRVTELLNANQLHVVDADIRGYFDTIPHDRLMEQVRQKIADGRVLGLIEQFLKHRVMDEMREWTATQGAPQGGVLSPLLSNIYLDGLDRELAKQGTVLIRYADDIVVLCATAAEAQAALEAVRAWMSKWELELNEEKTRVVDMRVDGAKFEFLGYVFKRYKGRILQLVRSKSIAKLRERLRPMTTRCNGGSLKRTIDKVNETYRGWCHYFRKALPNTFTDQEQWIRQRLRAMLHKRTRHYGRVPTGPDFVRWPNAFFAATGLFSQNQDQSTASYVV